MDASAVDLTTIIKPVVEVGGLLIGGVLAMAVRSVTNFAQVHLHLKMTEQDQRTLQGVADTMAGYAENLLSAGMMQVYELHVANPRLRALGERLVAMAPDAADALGVTVEGATHMILGRISRGVIMSKVLTGIPPVPDAPATPAQAAPAVPASTFISVSTAAT